MTSNQTRPAEKVKSGDSVNRYIPESIYLKSMKSVGVPNASCKSFGKSNTKTEISSIYRFNLE